MLRPAVEGEDRLALAGLGHVHAQPAGVHVAVLDTGDVGKIVRHLVDH